MARGHSARHGRSRCCAKVGPGKRSHKRKSLRPDTDHKAEGGQRGRSQSDPLAVMVEDARPDGRRAT
jgi:hypothetical protein